MPKTINFGTGSYQVPDSLDQGDPLFTILDTLFSRMINHSHTGVDSKSISLNIAKDETVFIKSIDIVWNAHLSGTTSYGMFEATMTMPGSAQYDKNIRRYFYRDSIILGSWKEFYPSTIQITPTTYLLLSSDNNIDVKVVTA